MQYHPLKHAQTPGEIDAWFDSYEGNFTGRIRVTDEEIEWARAYGKRLRETTDKAFVSDYVFGILHIVEGMVGTETIYMNPVSYTHLDVYKRQALCRSRDPAYHKPRCAGQPAQRRLHHACLLYTS